MCNFSVLLGLCLILKDNMVDKSLSDIEVILFVWLFLFCIGSLLIIKYVFLMVFIL